MPYGLTIVRIAIGIFFFFMGLGKLGWFADSSVLVKTLSSWSEMAGPFNRWYLESIALPAAPVFARVVPLAELATGLGLILGAWTRAVAVLAFLMVLNFHFASGALFRYAFLTNAFGLPVLGPLAGLACGAVRLPLSLRK